MIPVGSIALDLDEERLAEPGIQWAAAEISATAVSEQAPKASRELKAASQLQGKLAAGVESGRRWCEAAWAVDSGLLISACRGPSGSRAAAAALTEIRTLPEDERDAALARFTWSLATGTLRALVDIHELGAHHGELEGEAALRDRIMVVPEADGRFRILLQHPNGSYAARALARQAAPLMSRELGDVNRLAELLAAIVEGRDFLDTSREATPERLAELFGDGAPAWTRFLESAAQNPVDPDPGFIRSMLSLLEPAIATATVRRQAPQPTITEQVEVQTKVVSRSWPVRITATVAVLLVVGFFAWPFVAGRAEESVRGTEEQRPEPIPEAPEENTPEAHEKRAETTTPTTPTKTLYQDSDGDGYGSSSATWQGDQRPVGYVENVGDCDDSNKAINPEATEVCDAGNVDENCDGHVDDADSRVTDAGKSNFYRDQDGDGYTTNTASRFCDLPAGYEAAAEGDCDDSNKAINPGAPETSDDIGIDNNCNDDKRDVSETSRDPQAVPTGNGGDRGGIASDTNGTEKVTKPPGEDSPQLSLNELKTELNQLSVPADPPKAGASVLLTEALGWDKQTRKFKRGETCSLADVNAVVEAIRGALPRGCIVRLPTAAEEREWELLPADSLQIPQRIAAVLKTALKAEVLLASLESPNGDIAGFLGTLQREFGFSREQLDDADPKKAAYILQNPTNSIGIYGIPQGRVSSKDLGDQGVKDSIKALLNRAKDTWPVGPWPTGTEWPDRATLRLVIEIKKAE